MNQIGVNQKKSGPINELEMEMRALEDIAIGEDLTPSLFPVTFVLRDSALTSHCSACFCSLPAAEETITIPTARYCSSRCSFLDSRIHSSSAENHLLSIFHNSPSSTWPDSADLRLALRLLSIISDFPMDGCNDIGALRCQLLEEPLKFSENNQRSYGYFERIGGLMTNRENLLLELEDSSIADRVRDGVSLMAKARKMQMNEDKRSENSQEFTLDELPILCLVLTNAVEVHDKLGCSIGIAVYGTAFSWINHSCSPNSCYRFSFLPDPVEEAPLKISAANAGHILMGDHTPKSPFSGFRNCYGPRIVVLSIQAISKGDEITITYTDLLQPKNMRREELWIKYRFLCSCKRCVALPNTYVDYALEALVPMNCIHQNLCNYTLEALKESFDDTVADYLSFGDASKLTRNLENLLIYGCVIDDPAQPASQLKLKLHPLHYLSLNAYISLASGYKVLANDALALNPESSKLEAFSAYKTSSAFSLLHAGGVHYLFTHEPCLIATAANFFVDAGESLLFLAATSSLWDTSATNIELSNILTYRCAVCSLGNTLEAKLDHVMNSGEIRSRIYGCIAHITAGIWHKLTSESRFLESIPNLIDFSWLEPEIRVDTAAEYRVVMKKESCDGDLRVSLVLLSIHCLWYGSLLLSKCSGSSVWSKYWSLLKGLFEKL